MFAPAPDHISLERTRGTPAGHRTPFLGRGGEDSPAVRESPPNTTTGAGGFLDRTEPLPIAPVQKTSQGPTRRTCAQCSQLGRLHSRMHSVCTR